MKVIFNKLWLCVCPQNPRVTLSFFRQIALLFQVYCRTGSELAECHAPSSDGGKIYLPGGGILPVLKEGSVGRFLRENAQLTILQVLIAQQFMRCALIPIVSARRPAACMWTAPRSYGSYFPRANRLCSTSRPFRRSAQSVLTCKRSFGK